jgi:hypothetical protein
VTPSAFPSPHDHIHREPGKAFVEGLRDWGIQQQLLLGGSKTLDTLWQMLRLVVVKLIVGSSIRLRKTSDRALWRSRPPPTQKRLLTAYMPAL